MLAFASITLKLVTKALNVTKYNCELCAESDQANIKYMSKYKDVPRSRIGGLSALKVISFLVICALIKSRVKRLVGNVFLNFL